MSDKYIIALGFFDCLHVGHRKLIEKTVELAKENNLIPAVFTFDDDFFNVLLRNEKYIYTLKERKELLNEIGIQEIFVGTPSKRFIDMNALEFLDYLDNLGVVGVVCGEDFTFGSDKWGANELYEWALCTGKGYYLQNIVKFRNEKISSQNIRKLLQEGRILEANALLKREFFIMGEVVSGRGEGKKFGYPTANINVSNSKLLPQYGVYKTHTFVEGKRYLSLTNVGNAPTFNADNITLETLILDFDENIYGKTISVHFDKKIRDICKFSSKIELKEQIEKDINEVTNL